LKKNKIYIFRKKWFFMAYRAIRVYNHEQNDDAFIRKVIYDIGIFCCSYYFTFFSIIQKSHAIALTKIRAQFELDFVYFLGCKTECEGWFSLVICCLLETISAPLHYPISGKKSILVWQPAHILNFEESHCAFWSTG
jgi:hypothetical protein